MQVQPTINVIGSLYQYGLAHDGKIVTETLQAAGFRVRFVANRRKNEWRPLFYCKPLGRFLRRDVNIFLERLRPSFFKMARFQVLIPNQEWVYEADHPYLPKLDLILCKSRHAEEIFSGLGCRTAFASFTSGDRRLGTEPKRREFFLMTANRLELAARVIEVWARHPEWPMLTVSGRHIPERAAPPNVHLIRDFVPVEEITQLQNTFLFSLGMTASEGFGHKLNESMSCGAVVIATDGPPMNELIRPERGFLVRWSRTEPQSLGTKFHFDADDLERTIERCLRLSSEEIAQLSANARSWFEENDRYFRQTLPETLRKLLASGTPTLS